MEQEIDLKKMSEDLIILKRKVAELMGIKEDLEFIRRTEEAHQRIESGECVEMEFDDFIEDMKKW